MVYRTKTYLAAEWDGEKNAIDKLYEWNNAKHLNLSFTDAHDLTQARDGSLNCSIKSSLATRLNSSKTFVLIVGKSTKSVRNGSCQYCGSYNSKTISCARNNSIDYSSYIEYECQKAIRDDIKIVVLYHGSSVNKSKCPEIIKDKGIHKAMWHSKDGSLHWDYQTIKDAING